MNKDLLYKELEEWYEMNHRILPWRETDDPYKIWISEIILQQTRVAQGMEYYHRLVTRFPDIQSLADAQEDEVLLYWQGLGYYSRARNMHKAAQQMKDHEMFKLNNDNINNVATESTPSVAKGKTSELLNPEHIFAALRSMPGVGDYTAGAIASFAFDLPYPALDGNVYRVLSRLYDCEIAFDTTQGKKHFRKLAEDLLDREHPRLFNSAIMELGALHCVPTAPDCPICPLNTWCKALANNTVELLPVRKPRPKVRDRYLEYTIYITPERTTLIHQRKGNDIWKHLWEFVETTSVDSVKNDNIDNLRGNQLPAALQGSASELSELLNPYKVIELTHVLSHQKLHAKFVIKNVSELPEIPDTVVVSLNDLDNYAFSRLTLKAIETLAQR
jgi:A/G-specific adenine glycosylase